MDTLQSEPPTSGSRQSKIQDEEDHSTASGPPAAIALLYMPQPPTLVDLVRVFKSSQRRVQAHAFAVGRLLLKLLRGQVIDKQRSRG